MKFFLTWKKSLGSVFASSDENVQSNPFCSTNSYSRKNSVYAFDTAQTRLPTPVGGFLQVMDICIILILLRRKM
jgi:hypothetical protein